MPSWKRVIVSGSDATLNSVTATAGFTGSLQGNATNVTGTVAVANGGTGQTTYTNGQLLIGNTTGNTLTKATLTAGSGITITNGNGSISIAATGGGGGIGGSGTTNYVAKFTGTTTVGTSSITDDGTNVGIGTTSPSAKLDVVGTIGVSKDILDTTAAAFKWDTLGYLYAGNFADPQGNLAYQVDAGIASITNQDSFDTSWIDNPSYNGQVLATVYAGEQVSAGQLVYLSTDGNWYLAAATAVITATRLIGIALKNADAAEKFAILLDGLIGISYHDQFGNIKSGLPLYISTTAGNVSETAPTTAGEFVRLVGHNIYENSSNYAVIRFQPDNTWIEL
jgi:hypothetical protein